MATEHFDTLIVGAGLSGIGAGVRMSENCPTKSYAILDGRERIGGTWDLFRYPGIRSDSDMYTLGFPFRPWNDRKAIAPGSMILNYIKDTAREFGIEQKVRFNHWVKRASWSSKEAQWTVEAEVGPNQDIVRYTCNFLYMCSGYYRYEGGYTPDFPGADQFQGRLIHPQQWPEDLDYSGKRVVVIGSGATAVTLVPALAEKCRTCDDVAALAHLRHRTAGLGPDHRGLAPEPAGSHRLRDQSVQECVAGHALLPDLPALAQSGPQGLALSHAAGTGRCL